MPATKGCLYACDCAGLALGQGFRSDYQVVDLIRGDVVVFVGVEKDNDKDKFVFVSRHGVVWQSTDPVVRGWMRMA